MRHILCDCNRTATINGTARRCNYIEIRMYKKISLPLSDKTIKKLKAGDLVLISGTIYTARDVAHKRLVESLNKNLARGRHNKKLPFNLKGALLYHAGPTPARPGQVIGSCGPTTSSRMDTYTPILLKYGLKGFIGKGKISEETKNALRRYNAVYFVTFGGAGAYLSKRIKKCAPVAYRDLGTEAIYKLELKDFPAVVWR